MQIIKRLVVLVTVFAFFIGAFVSVSRAQDLIDWWKLRDYQPPSDIVALADISQMSDKGRKLFYLHDPVILNKNDFQQSCTVGEETIVLGCYISKSRIYLYDVTEERLKGIEEVTAAHEMLHAAYDRLSPSEKDRVNQLLEEAYARITDERLRKNIASYEQRDPSIVLNELHSILGTEVAELPKDLEVYYSQYFTDRQAVVTLSKTYAEEFVKREDQIKAYDAQLAAINSEIVRKQADLTVQNQALQNERTLLEGLRSDPETFNQGVGSYNAKVAAYNSDVAALKTLVESYNQIVSKRNEIAVQERELVEAIDTRAEQL